MDHTTSNDAVFNASQSVGKDLLSCLITELKLLPDVWQKLPENKQTEIIDRVRARVERNVRDACNAIAADGRVACLADLEGISIKDDIKASFRVARANGSENLQAFFDSVGEACLVIVSNTAAHLVGTSDIKADKDQLDLPEGAMVEGAED